MINNKHVSVVIPAKDEANAIGLVIRDLIALRSEGSSLPLIDCITVCDNGSTDATAEAAFNAGAQVISQTTPGYGIACLTALAHLPATDIILFIDGDHSFYAEQGIPLINAIDQGADLAIGSRTLGKQARGALTPPQKFGNLLASFLIRHLWGVPITDLGPFRAISSTALKQLDMQDQEFGWTVEMQVKAAQARLNVVEKAVDTRKRIGFSKISGTISGTIGASKGILGTIFRLWLQQSRAATPVFEQKTP
ncbi:MAG: dolichol-phosphate mannosyltransferase [Gammaproteobacteria bacterium]|nr:MAG: dolichol-phosphate mannosyltransferase [Gammaproteobacteria bacterium]